MKKLVHGRDAGLVDGAIDVARNFAYDDVAVKNEFDLLSQALLVGGPLYLARAFTTIPTDKIRHRILFFVVEEYKETVRRALDKVLARVDDAKILAAAFERLDEKKS